MKLRFDTLTKFLLALLVCVGSTSCAATVGEAEMVAMLPSVRPDPPARGKNNIYFNFRDLTAEGDLEDQVFYGLEEAIQDKGWNLVDYHNEADYVLQADLRLFSKAGTEEGNQALAALGGFASGAAIGGLTYKATDKWWVGAGAGSIGGALTGKLIEMATRKNHYQMVIDVELGQRVEGGVETRRGEGAESAMGSVVAASSGWGAETGGSKSSSSKSQELTEVRVHFEMQQRLLARVGGRRCTKEMAAEKMIPKLIQGVRNQLPRVRERR